MLHSTVRNCSYRHNSYLGHSENRIEKENEIVSTIFGPLEFINPTEVYLFMRKVAFGRSPDLEPISAEFRFWTPRRINGYRGKGVEPDAHFVFTFNNNIEHHFLLEFKWDSKLSDGQLREQWDSYLTENEKPNTTHIFIGKSTKSAINAKKNNDIGNENSAFSIRSWLEIRSILNEIKNTESGIGKWAYFSDMFLEKIGIINFGGFSQFNHLPSIPTTKNKTIFWQPFRFGDYLKMTNNAKESTLADYFKIVQKCGNELDGFIGVLSASLTEALSNNHNLPCRLSEDKVEEGYDGTHWIYTSYHKSFPLKAKGKGRQPTKRYLSFQIAMTGDHIGYEKNNEPLVHVSLWGGPVDFNTKNDDIKNFVILPDVIDQSDEIFRERIIIWNEESETEGWLSKYWTFSVRLSKLNSINDIEVNIVNPAMQLINCRPLDSALPDDLPALFFYSAFIQQDACN